MRISRDKVVRVRVTNPPGDLGTWGAQGLVWDYDYNIDYTVCPTEGSWNPQKMVFNLLSVPQVGYGTDILTLTYPWNQQYTAVRLSGVLGNTGGALGKSGALDISGGGTIVYDFSDRTFTVEGARAPDYTLHDGDIPEVSTQFPRVESLTITPNPVRGGGNYNLNFTMYVPQPYPLVVHQSVFPDTVGKVIAGTNTIWEFTVQLIPPSPDIITARDIEFLVGVNVRARDPGGQNVNVPQTEVSRVRSGTYFYDITYDYTGTYEFTIEGHAKAFVLYSWPPLEPGRYAIKLLGGELKQVPTDMGIIGYLDVM